MTTPERTWVVTTRIEVRTSLVAVDEFEAQDAVRDEIASRLFEGEDLGVVAVSTSATADE